MKILRRIGDWSSWHEDEYWTQDMKENLSLVSTVIATITFQAMINPPGGFIQQGLVSKENTTSSISVPNNITSSYDLLSCGRLQNNDTYCPGQAMASSPDLHNLFKDYLRFVTISFSDATPRLLRFSTRDPEAQVNLTKRPVAAHGQNMAVHIAHAISFCFTPGLGFTGLGGLILKNTSRWSFFAAAAAGSTTVGIPTGLAWYALFRYLERRREHLRYGDDDGVNVEERLSRGDDQNSHNYVPRQVASDLLVIAIYPLVDLFSDH